MAKQHIIPVVVQDHLDTLPREARSLPVNLYVTDRYVVVHAGLPRCRPEKIQVFVAPGEILILAERHEGEPTEAVRAYLISELPFGMVGRVISLPEGKWRYHDAEAHFANGLLTVTIPTEARAEYLKEMHTAA